MSDRLAGGGGPIKIVEVRMGDSGIPGSSILVGELTDGVLMSGGKWLVSSNIVRVRGERIRFPSTSNLTRGDSIVDKCDNWDGDIGTSSKK
jgi:hypothetical protein